MAEETSNIEKQFSEEEIREGQRLLRLLRQLEAGAPQKVAAPVTAPPTPTASGWLGATMKIALAIVLLITAILIGVVSGAFGTNVQQGYQQEYQRQMQSKKNQVAPTEVTRASDASEITDLAAKHGLQKLPTEADVRTMLTSEIARGSEDAGLGDDGRELVAKLKESIEINNQNAIATQKAYEDALRHLAEARDAARARGARGVDVEAAVRETLDRIGIKADPQDISCLTDPNWDPAKAAAAMVAEQNARSQAQQQAPLPKEQPASTPNS
ncbi:MAG: hypothetical protein IKZ87_08035 [Actinomycetaceae bacterium]|nr:hypothetical protein [Actinomycetaceae bacterium]